MSVPWIFSLFFGSVILAHFFLGLWARRGFPSPTAPHMPGVSVIKPVKGVDDATRRALASFFTQRYPGPYELVFGLQDEDDPAIPLIAKLKEEHPGVTVKVTVNPVKPGMSGKTSNLYHATAIAAHDLLVFSDADMEASGNFVQGLVEPLLQKETGLSAAVPVHRGASGFWALLYQLQINVTILAQWLPWVKVFPLGVSGGTLAVRREVLEEVGGVEAFAGYLLDDVRIGLLVRRAGYRLSIGPEVTAHVGRKEAPDTLSLLARGAAIYRFMLGLPLTSVYFLGAYLYLPLLALYPWLGTEVAGAALAHLALKTAALYLVSRVLARTDGREALLTPVLDLIFLYLFARVALTRTIDWRGRRYRIDGEGRILSGDPS